LLNYPSLLLAARLGAATRVEEAVLVALARTDGLERGDGVVGAGPGAHFAVALAPLLRQLVPVLGLGEQLADRALRQAQNELGEDALPDVVQAEQVAHLLRDLGRVDRLVAGATAAVRDT